MGHKAGPSPVCVIDTNVLFDAVAGGILPDLFGLACVFLITDIAVREVRTIPLPDLLDLGLEIRELTGVQVLEMLELRGKNAPLSIADLSVLVLARQTGAVLLSGDGPLRTVARREGVEVHGILWVLDRLVAGGVLSGRRAAEVIGVMRQNGSRLPEEECERRIRAWMR